jgi:hypothetical protein
MFKKICQDLFIVLLPLIIILTPHPIQAADVRQDFSNNTSVEDNLRGAIRYWWIAPVALIPVLFFLWPKDEVKQRPAYRRTTVYQSVRKPSKKKKVAKKKR